MSEVVEFLLARLAEDEVVARAMPFEPEWIAHPEKTGQPIIAGNARIATCAESVMPHIARHDPARVLAEVAAKRRIVDLADHLSGRNEVGGAILRALASVYADDPDWREEWAV